MTSMSNLECANCDLENTRKDEKCLFCISQRDINNPACDSCDFRSSERINYCKQVCGDTAKDSKMATKNHRIESSKCERCLYWISNGSLRDSSCNEICSPFQLRNILTPVVDRTNRISWLQEKPDLPNAGCASIPQAPIIIFLGALNPVRSKYSSSLQSTAAPPFIIMYLQNLQPPGRSGFPNVPGFAKSFYDIISQLFGGKYSIRKLGEPKFIGSPEEGFYVSPAVVTQTNIIKIPPSISNYLDNIDESTLYFPTDLQNPVKNDVKLGTSTPETRPIGSSSSYSLENYEILKHPFDLQKPLTMYQESLGKPHAHNKQSKKQLIYKPGSPNLSIQVLDMNRRTERPQTPPPRHFSFNEPVNKLYEPRRYDLFNNENRLQSNPFYELVPTKRPYFTFGSHIESLTDMSLDGKGLTGKNNVLPEIQQSFFEQKYVGQPGRTHGGQTINGPPNIPSSGNIYKSQLPKQTQNPLGVRMLHFSEIPETLNPKLSDTLVCEGSFKPLQNPREFKNILGGRITSNIPDTFYQTQFFHKLQRENNPLSMFKTPNDERLIYFLPEKLNQLNTLGGKRQNHHEQNHLSNVDHQDTQFGGKRQNERLVAFQKPQGIRFSQSAKELGGQIAMDNYGITDDRNEFGKISAISFPVGSENDKTLQNVRQSGINNGQSLNEFTTPNDYGQSNTVVGNKHNPNSYMLTDDGQFENLFDDPNRFIEDPNISLKQTPSESIGQSTLFTNSAHRPIDTPNTFGQPYFSGELKNIASEKRTITYTDYFHEKPLDDDSMWFPEMNGNSKNVHTNRPIVTPDQTFETQNAGQSTYGEQNPTALSDTFYRLHGFGDSKETHNGKRPSKLYNGFVSPQKYNQYQSIPFGKEFKVDQTKYVSPKYDQYGAQTDDSGNYETLYNDGHRGFIYGGQRLGVSNKSTAPHTPKQLGGLKILSSQYRELSGQPNTSLNAPKAQKDHLRSNNDENHSQRREKEFFVMRNITSVFQMQDEPVKAVESMIDRQLESEKLESIPYHDKATAVEEKKLFDQSLYAERINNILNSNGRNTFGSKHFHNQTVEVHAPDSGQRSGFEMVHHNEGQNNMSNTPNSDQSVSIDSTNSSESMAVRFGKANNVEKDYFDQTYQDRNDLSMANFKQENLIVGSQSSERQTGTPKRQEVFEVPYAEEEQTDNQNAKLQRSNYIESAQYDERSDNPSHPSPAMVSLNSHPVRETVMRSKPVRYGNTSIYIV